jgi:hypothetical protein
MKAKLLSFVFIYFSESGLFKGLRPKKIKKFVFVRLAQQVVADPPHVSASAVFTGQVPHCWAS